MMNKKRVRFFKRLIYAFIIIVLFLPLILMSFLALRMISISQNMQEQLETLTSAITQPASQSSSQGGYVIEPQGQSTNGEVPPPQTTDGKNTESPADDQAPNASGTQPEADGIPPAQNTSDTGGASINDVGNNTLNGINNGEQTGAAVIGNDGNPGTGNNPTADPSPPNYNGNPGMGF